MATGPSTPYHVLHSLPENKRNGSISSSSNSTLPLYHSTSMHKRGRVSIARAILLVSASLIFFTLLHISYTTSHSPFSATEPDSQQNAPKSSKSADIDNPPPKDESNRPGTIILDSELTSTMRYDDGTQAKFFKAAFFKDSVAAKANMGSFMHTLATKSWWARSPSVASERVNNYSDLNKEDNSQLNDDQGVKEEKEDDEEDNDRDSRNIEVGTSGRYFTYLPMGGGNNQFISLQKAALLAKDLNRTLILPSISPNSHIKSWAGPRYSMFYDIDSFTAKSGIPVIEWHDLKQTPETVPDNFAHHWIDFSEDFPCIPNGGIGTGTQEHTLYDHFRPQFLLNYSAIILPEDKTHGKATDYKYARDFLLRDSPSAVPKTTTAEPGADPHMWKCLSNPYALVGPNVGERAWFEVGVHLRFNDKTEAMVDDILDVLLGPVENTKEFPATTTTTTTTTTSLAKTKPFRPHPEFIVIHLRRGDIVSKCPVGMAEKDCIVQIEEIAEKVDEIEKTRRMAALATHKTNHQDESSFQHKRLPVLVATNEKQAEELEKLHRLGWILLDHGDEETDEQGKVKPSTTKKLGTMSRLGPWFPPMLDAVLLTRGNYLIGMHNSRMSILAAQRGKAWHGHTTMLM
ncbi:hypothetical protein EC968_008360 [Mortierella alpina]|nr:hypothetical protein EC968_008360 [Mortierella alpina]